MTDDILICRNSGCQRPCIIAVPGNGTIRPEVDVVCPWGNKDAIFLPDSVDRVLNSPSMNAVGLLSDMLPDMDTRPVEHPDGSLWKVVTYFGKTVVMGCDGKCDKAWGINNRPHVYLGDEDEDPDDYYYPADNELGKAPEDPGTYEGGHGKWPKGMNKWCARECERCKLNKAGDDTFEVRDYSTVRSYNCPESFPEGYELPVKKYSKKEIFTLLGLDRYCPITHRRI